MLAALIAMAGWAPLIVRVVVATLPFGVTGFAEQLAADEGENEQEKLT